MRDQIDNILRTTRIRRVLGRIRLALAVLKNGATTSPSSADSTEQRTPNEELWEEFRANTQIRSYIETLQAAGVFELWMASGYHASSIAASAPYLARFGPGHFYSALPSLAQVTDRFRPSELPGIDLDLDEILADASTLSTIELPGPRYRPDNDQFLFSDAIQLQHILEVHKPRQFVEIGSGYSTTVVLDALESLNLTTKLTCIEPHADRLRSQLLENDEHRLTLIEQPVQTIPLETFTNLEAGDVLFIDSTHVVAPGSDVVYELLEILPRLQSGVVVHLHDIVYPFEMPDLWLEEGRIWCEPYLLRALLTNTSRYRVTKWMSALVANRPDELRATLGEERALGGSSLWLEIR